MAHFKGFEARRSFPAALVMGIAAIGVIGNGFSAWLLHRDAKKSLNVRGAFLHMMGDMLTSVVVLLNGLILIYQALVLAGSASVHHDRDIYRQELLGHSEGINRHSHERHPRGSGHSGGSNVFAEFSGYFWRSLSPCLEPGIIRRGVFLSRGGQRPAHQSDPATSGKNQPHAFSRVRHRSPGPAI